MERVFFKVEPTRAIQFVNRKSSHQIQKEATSSIFFLFFFFFYSLFQSTVCFNKHRKGTLPPLSALISKNLCSPTPLSPDYTRFPFVCIRFSQRDLHCDRNYALLAEFRVGYRGLRTLLVQSGLANATCRALPATAGFSGLRLTHSKNRDYFHRVDRTNRAQWADYSR